MRITVKVCGLTREEDARAAIEAGADYLGFVFFPLSRRCLGRQSWEWVRHVGGAPKVGVFRDQEASFVNEVAGLTGLDMIQLHGSEPASMCQELARPGRVIKAVSVGDSVDWAAVEGFSRVARVLFDTSTPQGGGSGRSFDWSLLAARPPELAFWLAGGLNPENVGRAVRELRPAGIDVASGVEIGVGRKDPARMKEFSAAVRLAESQS